MKKQTFIAKMVDDRGDCMDFYRFSCKKVSTVEKNIREAMSEDNTGLMGLFRRDWIRNGVVACLIFETPDGATCGGNLVREFPMDLVKGAA